MRPSEQSAQRSSASTGLLAALGGLFREQGRRAPSSASRNRRRLVATLLLTALGLLLFAIPTLAAEEGNGPTISEFKVAAGQSKEELYATRVELSSNLGSNGSETRWSIEYITAEALKKAQEEGKAAEWALGASGTRGPAQNAGEGFQTTIHHLTPKTPYFARLKAVNESGEAASPAIEFTTVAAGPPEFALRASCPVGFFSDASVPYVEGLQMCVKVRMASADVLVPDLETNGAETKYRLESATSEAGPYAPVPGAAGTITVAEDFAQPEAHLTGLARETTYYVRAHAENGHEPAPSETVKFTTPSGLPHASMPEATNVTATAAHLHGTIDPRSSETHWRFEYATSEGGPWTSGPAGAITAAEADEEEDHNVSGDLTALKPGTAYYVRLFAENECVLGCGAATSAASSFQTSGPPTVTTFATHALHGESLRILGSVDPHNQGLNEIQTVTIGGAPTGGTFTLTLEGQTTAETATGSLTAGSKVIRDVSNASGGFNELAFILGQPISGAGIPAGTIITGSSGEGISVGRLTLSQSATASGTAVALTTGPPRIPFNADGSTVANALGILPNIGEGLDSVEGPRGGPYTVEFVGPKGSTNLPSLEADASGLTPSGTVTVATVQDGFSYPTHYHFEYISATDFQANGESFGGSHPPTVTAEHQVEGTKPQIVGQDLPGLQPGETYRYRIVATNTTPGNPVVYGAEQTLTVPVSAASGVEEPCANAATRTGLSAGLPDCRAYEQVSPVDKEGAQDALQYGGGAVVGGLVGEDGNHFMFASPVTRWGTSPASGQSPYFFTRNPQSGWQMTGGAAQPEAGFDQYTPLVFNPDLTAFGFEAWWSESPNVEFRVGSPGGPYTTVATVPRKDVNAHAEAGWVGASEDFSKLILAVGEDRKLVEPQSTTKSGSDLYEYAAGTLRQVNVDSAGRTIGSCGATIVNGNAERLGVSRVSTRHAVSAEGGRVFFSARPGANCSEPEHLYMREAAAGRTLDIGAYTFLAANARGSEVLLESGSGVTREVLLYNTETAVLKSLFSEQDELHLTVSRDFSTIYLTSAEQLPGTNAPPPTLGGASDLYRYDISTGALSFVLQYLGNGGDFGGEDGISPDGRYDYFSSQGVPGVPGGAPSAEAGENRVQLYRYDSVTNSVECVSCASPFDPEPRLGINHTGGSLATNWATDGTPQESFFSANGDYAFFETPAALLPADVNGEVAPSEAGRFGGTPSNDIYEWRREGLHGCAHVQGCLSLITPGTRDGYLVALIGATESGNDVFFYTSQSLLPRDNDTAGDFYDARVGGGFAEPAGPVECEGDACVSPLAAPIDTTPASLAFSGPGNPTPSLTTAQAKAKAKAKVKAKPCKKRGCAKRKGRARKRKAKPSRRGHSHRHGGQK